MIVAPLVHSDNSSFLISNFQSEVIYRSITKSIKTNLSELIKKFPKVMEMERLVNRFYLEDSCAAILNTCDLDERNEQHGKVFREKALILHPDKNSENYRLAQRAMAVLDSAGDIWKTTKTCPGQDSRGCKILMHALTVTKRLTYPVSKAEDLPSICEKSINRGPFKQVSLDFCDDVVEMK